MSAATFEARVHHAYPVAGVSGVALMLVQGQRPWQERWRGLKILLMIAIVANAALLIVPTEDQLLHLATALPASEARESFVNAALKQQIYGAANLTFITLAAVLGVVKPRLQGARASCFTAHSGYLIVCPRSETPAAICAREDKSSLVRM